MTASDKKLIEEFEADFHKIASQEGWSKEDLEKMKDLQKLMYYMEVRCAMKEGQDYPGSDYMDSYARGPMRNVNTGRFMSHSGYPMSYYNRHNEYEMSGRRYYDDEKMSVVNTLRRMHQTEQNPETKMALERVIGDLEMR